MRLLAFASACAPILGAFTGTARAAEPCRDVAFEGSIQIPIGGAIQRIVRLDASCNATFVDRLVSAAEVDFILRSGHASSDKSDQVRPRLSGVSSGKAGLAKPVTMVAGGPIHMFNRIKDAAGLNVTSIDPHNFSYGYNGSTITSTTHDATVNRSTESGTCGPGWSINWGATAISISGGGVGYTFADSLTHAEFSYQGAFDCAGATYYNILDTKLTGFGNGSSSTCAYRTQLRNTYFGWYQELLCWDAYVWTTPPAF